MGKLILLLAGLASVSTAFAVGDFPLAPDARLTPGSLCQDPDSYRYPEHIPYCERNVDSGEKWRIMQLYDTTYGYHTVALAKRDRSQFKIDHYLCLCMGGSNEETNLWPQHVSVGRLTDPLEQSTCDRMKAGTLKQVDAVALMKKAKAHPEDIQKAIALVEELKLPAESLSEVFEATSTAAPVAAPLPPRAFSPETYPGFSCRVARESLEFVRNGKRVWSGRHHLPRFDLIYTPEYNTRFQHPKPRKIATDLIVRYVDEGESEAERFRGLSLTASQFRFGKLGQIRPVGIEVVSKIVKTSYDTFTVESSGGFKKTFTPQDCGLNQN